MRDREVDRGEKKFKGHISGRTLRMPGLKPSDYWLFDHEKAFFGLDMRELVVLGLRVIHRGFQDERLREIIYQILDQVKADDLDIQGEKVVYQRLEEFLPNVRR